MAERLSILDNIYTSISKWWRNIGQIWRGSPSDGFTGRNGPRDMVLLGDSEPKFRTVLRLLIPLLTATVSLGLTYYLIEQLANPDARQKKEARKRAEKLFAQLGIPKKGTSFTDYELSVAVNLIDAQALSTRWEDIGGLDEEIQELRESVILPFRRPDLFAVAGGGSEALFQAPKGVLFYGPPGCGKTMIARAMAREAEARFINLQISSLVNMWYGETQKLVDAVFSLAYKLQPSIIFIDEIDSFLTTRSSHDHESTRIMKTQFMAQWDGLLTDAKARVLIVGATNRPQDLDQAIMRRLPNRIRIPLPNEAQRHHILRVLMPEHYLATDILHTDWRAELARRCEGFSGSDLHEVCREAVVHRVRTLIREMGLDATNSVAPERLQVGWEDFNATIAKMRSANPVREPSIALD